MFGCPRCFHTAAAPWKACVFRQWVGIKKDHWKRTRLIPCPSPSGRTFMRLIRNLVSEFVAHSEVGATSMGEPENVHNFGKAVLTLHIFPSSCRASLNSEHAGLITLVSACTCDQKK